MDTLTNDNNRNKIFFQKKMERTNLDRIKPFLNINTYLFDLSRDQSRGREVRKKVDQEALESGERESRALPIDPVLSAFGARVCILSMI